MSDSPIFCKGYFNPNLTNLLVSFSGGETSAYMAWWLWMNKRDTYNMVFVFANTGEEDKATLWFIREFERHFKIPIVWIEAVTHLGVRKGNTHKIVTYETASREEQPFEQVIRKYGIPNTTFPHCTRELKMTPIKSFARSLGWQAKDYETAIGIRIDEADRINSKAKELRLIYPLVNAFMRPMTKQKINFWWSQQVFRLKLKGYEGNCKTCWKKSDKKLFAIANENPMAFRFMSKMELRYGNFTPESRVALQEERGEPPSRHITFFRKNRSAIDIINQAKRFSKVEVKDDNTQYDIDGGQCEIFSACGD